MIRHRDSLLLHLCALGLCLNGQKRVLAPVQQPIFGGDCLDSTLMQACLAPAWVESIQSCLARFRLGRRVSVGLCCRLLGLMVPASLVIPLRLLHIRLLELLFEPLGSATERILTLKVTLLLALASFKRVGDLQALSVSESCTEFAPGLVKAILRPRLGYVPKVLNTSFYSQVVVLQAFSPSSSSEGDDLHLLSPVRALKMYVDHSSQRCKSLQLLVCFGAGRRGLASRDAISLAYEVRVCLHL